MSALPNAGGNSRTTWIDPYDRSQSPNTYADESDKRDSLNEEVREELNLFLLKPVVRDYFDKIELSWSVQDTKMQGPAIRKHLDKNEEDGIPSVIDMLENLHAYEQAMIDTELLRGGRRHNLPALGQVEGYVAERDRIYLSRGLLAMSDDYRRFISATLQDTDFRDENPVEQIPLFSPPSSPALGRRMSSDKGEAVPGIIQQHFSMSNEDPLAQIPKNESQSLTTEGDTYRMITINTEEGPNKVPVDMQAVSKVPDVKRARNTLAARKSRARRHEKEDEAYEHIARLELQIEALENEKLSQRYPVEPSGGPTVEGERPASQDNESPGAEQEDEDAVVVALLERYTTLFDKHHDSVKI